MSSYKDQMKKIQRLSLSERKKTGAEKGIYYASYALTDTLSDMEVYERVYINELKPLCNTNEKHIDDITFEYPVLDFSIPLFIKNSWECEDSNEVRQHFLTRKELKKWNPHPTPRQIYGENFFYHQEISKTKMKLRNMEIELSRYKDAYQQLKRWKDYEETIETMHL